ncbi:MAG: TIM barrel protein [Limisphaerales bacterium]
MFAERITRGFIDEANSRMAKAHEEDLECLAEQLARRGVSLERVVRQSMPFAVAVPSWGFRQGGTRFGRFRAKNEPVRLEEKLFAAALLNDLAGVTPRISLHIPWDTPESVVATRKLARQLGLKFDAMNSNTFEDAPGQQQSYKYGSLSHTDPAVRRQAIEHNIRCVELGEELGSKALVVWLADGSNFPGQQNFRRALDRTIDSLENIYERLPKDWRLLIEYKPFEPAFYSTVINDWGTALMVCQELGKQASCLVDLGHHLPNTNVEQVVARLVAANRLGGFHFNDSKYADDDVSSGSIRPYQLFLIFNELIDAAQDPLVKSRRPRFSPSYMIDQSHNIKDPLEDLITSAVEIQRAFVKALLVNRKTLTYHQIRNDVTMAERVLKTAFETDVSPMLAEIRRRKGCALDPILAYRNFLSSNGKAAGKER